MKSVVLAALDSSPRQTSTFVYHHCKGEVFANIFLCRKFVSNVFGLGSVDHWMYTTIGFLAYAKNIFPPETMSHWHHR